MKHKKKLSIIIPVYNVEKYLKRCIESVINQCGDDSEIILIDDGSTDLSGIICDNYQMTFPNSIRVVHKKNGGLSSARNKGIECAEGEYLFFLDSDDCVTQTFVHDISNKLVNDTYDIVEFECCLERQFNQYKSRKSRVEKILTPSQSIEKIIKNQVGNQICLRVYKKTLFDNVRFPLGRNYEDISTHYKLVLNSKKIIHLNTEYYIYNITNQNSITKKNNIKNMNDMYLAVNELCEGVQEICKENNVDMTYIEYYKRHSYIYIVLKLIEMGNEAENLKNKIINYLKVNNRYNIIKYRYYDLKRWLYFEMLLAIKIILNMSN